MPSKTKKSISKFIVSEENMKGGLKPKDDPDKIDKEEFEEDNDENIDDEEEKKENTEDENSVEDEEDEEDEDEEDEEEKDDDEKGDENEENEENDDACMYKLTKNSKKKKNPLNIEIEDNFEDEFEEEINNKYVKPNERKTKPYLFDFEKVRLLGDRARQLSMGAKPMIKNIEVFDPKVIAKLELEKKVIPMIILRELPNGLIEKWKVSELNFF